jgi:hypothetical protein
MIATHGVMTLRLSMQRTGATCRMPSAAAARQANTTKDMKALLCVDVRGQAVGGRAQGKGFSVEFVVARRWLG